MHKKRGVQHLLVRVEGFYDNESAGQQERRPDWTAEPASALMYKEPRPDQHTQREKASVFRASGGVAHNDIMLKRA